MSQEFDPLSKGHACIVTDNIEKLRQNWKKYLGIDLTPNFVMEGPAVVRGENKGECKVLIAFADIGDLRLEFIQPVEGGTQEWEFIKKNASGIHHIDPILPRRNTLAEHVNEWEKRGIKVLQIDKKNRWAYMDTHELLGTIIELH
ncbi:MAG: VOC family protein [Candidatus Bathyarchaeia archaeon]|jgi:catechol-2,3-dioxygenase